MVATAQVVAGAVLGVSFAGAGMYMVALLLRNWSDARPSAENADLHRSAVPMAKVSHANVANLRVIVATVVFETAAHCTV